MKKTRNLFVLALLLPFLTQAQFNFGLKGGLNYTNLSGQMLGLEDKQDSYNFKTGYHAGAFGAFDFSEKLGIQTEVLYSLKGSDKVFFTQNGLDGSLDLKYLDIPLLVNYHPVQNLTINLGATFSFLLNEDDFFDGFVDNTFETALSGGASYRIFEFLGISARYSQSLNPFWEITYTDINGESIGTESHKNKVLQLSLAYYFMM